MEHSVFFAKLPNYRPVAGSGRGWAWPLPSPLGPVCVGASFVLTLKNKAIHIITLKCSQAFFSFWRKKYLEFCYMVWTNGPIILLTRSNITKAGESGGGSRAQRDKQYILKGKHMILPNTKHSLPNMKRYVLFKWHFGKHFATYRHICTTFIIFSMQLE